MSPVFCEGCTSWDLDAKGNQVPKCAKFLDGYIKKSEVLALLDAMIGCTGEYPACQKNIDQAGCHCVELCEARGKVAALGGKD